VRKKQILCHSGRSRFQRVVAGGAGAVESSAVVFYRRTRFR
jgi:hypothetical protein